MKPVEVRLGTTLEVRVVKMKDNPEALYLTVALSDADLEGPIATFRFNKQ